MTAITERPADGEWEGYNVVRLEWPDGSWWEILDDQPHAVYEQLQQVLVTAGVTDAESAAAELEEDKSEALRLIQAGYMTRLLGCSVAWSWDDEITEEAINRRPGRKVREVRMKMAELHVAAADAADSKKNSSSLSSKSPEPTESSLKSRRSGARRSRTGTE